MDNRVLTITQLRGEDDLFATIEEEVPPGPQSRLVKSKLGVKGFVTKV